MDPQPSSFLMWIGGIVSSAVLATLTLAFGHTHSRINQVRDESKRDLELAMRSIDEKLADGQHDRDELRTLASSFQSQHLDLLTRMGSLPTREEMKGDLAAMEKRISVQLDRISYPDTTQRTRS